MQMYVAECILLGKDTTKKHTPSLLGDLQEMESDSLVEDPDIPITSTGRQIRPAARYQGPRGSFEPGIPLVLGFRSRL